MACKPQIEPKGNAVLSASHSDITRLQENWRVVGQQAESLARCCGVAHLSSTLLSAAVRHWRLRRFNVGLLPWCGLSSEASHCWIHFTSQLTSPTDDDYANPAEAAYIVDLLHYLITYLGYRGNIAVVSPYGAQIDQIRQQAKSNRILAPRLAKTVVIGNEKTVPLSHCGIVILSTVIDTVHASTDCRWTDCLATLGRLRRPRSCWIVVGDYRILEQGPNNWSKKEGGRILFPSFPVDDPWIATAELLKLLQQRQQQRLFIAAARIGVRLLSGHSVAGTAVDFIAIAGNRRLAIMIDWLNRSSTGRPCIFDDADWSRANGWTATRFSGHDIIDRLPSCLDAICRWRDENNDRKGALAISR
jgi:hypothetical protein